VGLSVRVGISLVCLSVRTGIGGVPRVGFVVCRGVRRGVRCGAVLRGSAFGLCVELVVGFAVWRRDGNDTVGRDLLLVLLVGMRLVVI